MKVEKSDWPLVIKVETEEEAEVLIDSLKVALENIDYPGKHPRYLFVLDLIEKLDA